MTSYFHFPFEAYKHYYYGTRHNFCQWGPREDFTVTMIQVLPRSKIGVKAVTATKLHLMKIQAMYIVGDWRDPVRRYTY